MLSPQPLATPPRPVPSQVTRRLRAVVVVLTLYMPLGIGLAQGATTPWRVGVITSASAGSALGPLQARVAERAAAAYASTGVFGAPLVVDVRDDGGDPRRARDLAQRLIDDGALALVCCSSPAASDRVSEVAEAAGVVLLGLDGGEPGTAAWTLALRADARTQLTAVAVHVAEQGKSGMALMTLDNAFGDDAADAFERALADTGRQSVGTVRYAPSAQVLTPEALWAATREPGAIVVWGLTVDTDRALSGLRARGWFGAAYVRPETVPSATWQRFALASDGPSAPPVGGDPWWQVRSAVAPVSVVDLLSDGHPNRTAAQAARSRIDALGQRLSPQDVASLALVDDAIVLLVEAFEQVAALGLPPELPIGSIRQAVLDALLSAPPRALSAGTYAARSSDARFARWQGLVVVQTR